MTNPTNQASGVAEPDDVRAVLRGVVELAKEALVHWDADRDAKVGKILFALAGVNERYDHRAAALHAALATQPAAPAEVVAKEGPGSPLARYRLLMAELEKRFPHPAPFSSVEPSELHYLRAIDTALASPAQAPAARHLTVSTDEQGRCVAVTWQDDEHRILEVVWEAPAAPSVGEPVAINAVVEWIRNNYQDHNIASLGDALKERFGALA